MKIVQILPGLGGLAGAERMVEALVLGLTRSGQEVVVVSLYSDRSVITEQLEAHGVKVVYLGKKRGLDLSMIGKLARVLRQEKPDVIHTHQYVCEYVIPAAILTGTKVRIHTVHNIAERERMPKKLQRFFYHHCKVTPVALSPVVKESVLKYYKLPDERVPMIYNGVDLGCIPTKTSYQQQGQFRFLHVGRFAPQKNHGNLVKAFEKLHRKYPHTSLTLVGTGELFDQVRDQIRELGLSEAVETPGQLDDVITRYGGYDAFLLPSCYEGVPLSLIEAMGAGMPVVVTPVGGVADMIEDGRNGLYCRADADSIFDAMERICLDESLRQRLGMRALEESARFSSEHMMKAYLEVYERAVQAMTRKKRGG